jgi:basic membrane protein A
MSSFRRASKTRKIRVGIALTFGILTKESGYSMRMIEGVERARKELGLGDALEYEIRVPSIPVTDEEVIETLSGFAESKKFDLIFAQGSAMGPPVANVAPKYPEQKFAVIDGTYGYPKMPNVATYIGKNEEVGFLRGYMLALITRTNVVGTIYGVDEAVVRRSIAAFIAGANFPDKNIEALYATLGSWTNPYKAEKIALLMYDYGADIVHTHADITSDVGVLRAARNRKKLVLGIPKEVDPEYFLWKEFRRMDSLLLYAIRSVAEGTFKSGTFAYGLKENHMGPLLEESHPILTDEIKKKVEEMKRRLIANEISLPMTKEQQLEQLRKGKEIVWHPRWQ